MIKALENGIIELANTDFYVEKIAVYNATPIPPSYYTCLPANRPVSRFVYIVSGGMIFNRNGCDRLEVNSGSVMYMPSEFGYISEWRTDEPSEYIAFHCNLVSREKKEIILYDHIEPVAVDTNGDYYRLFSSMYSDYLSSGIDIKFKLCAELYELIGKIIEDIIKDNIRKDDSSMSIYKGIRYLEKNYSADTPISELAQMCHMSESTFRRNFKASKGMSPVCYRNNLRLNKAKELLESGMYTVGEAAEVTNYYDISYFSKSFKEKFGQNPSDCLQHM